MRIAIGPATLLLSGCVSMQEVRNDKEGGTIEIYQGSKEVIWKAAYRALLNGGVTMVDKDEDNWALFGVVPADFNIPDTYCGVWLKDKDGAVEVRCLTRRGRSLSIGTGLTEGRFHWEMKRHLGLLPDIPEPRKTGRYQ